MSRAFCVRRIGMALLSISNMALTTFGMCQHRQKSLICEGVCVLDSLEKWCLPSEPRVVGSCLHFVNYLPEVFHKRQATLPPTTMGA